MLDSVWMIGALWVAVMGVVMSACVVNGRLPRRM